MTDPSVNRRFNDWLLGHPKPWQAALSCVICIGWGVVAILDKSVFIASVAAIAFVRAALQITGVLRDQRNHTGHYAPKTAATLGESGGTVAADGDPHQEQR
ncbi:hypothetical protein [Curtobacterium sp. MCBD17_040]|uniref:hypothetical protein n=1 Tax=Curtobacterium sp. MCBD17_040 TaxID=2175674 RepID=UPI000DAA572B|nr:hypothetical protein [Curtobacterium sp. MCBD17_040]WIB65561.1 hypothetical protein DEI94_19495 [Curtobacterium sp. MCBD17_040]